MADEAAPPAVAEPAEGEGNDAEGKGKEGKSQKSLEQMMSLKPGDDERTEISKKVSWILRHGAKKVGLEIDDNGYIKIQDLLENDILQGVTKERLMETVEQSNVQKPRYEVSDLEDGSKAIRAVSKHTIQGMAAPPKERGPRRRDFNAEGGEEGGKGSYGDWGKGGGRDRDTDGQDRYGDKGGGPTFEQQLRDGFRPVYQGNHVVAMVKNSELVKPGRRAEGKGGGKGDFKGKGKDGNRDDWQDGGGKGYGRSDYGRGDFGGDGKGKGKGKGKGDGFPRYDEGGGWKPERPRNRWMVIVKEEVIVKDGAQVTSKPVGKLHSGDVVTQTAAEQVIEHGIVRMPIEHRQPGGQIVCGWVTRTAEAAQGPCFFKPVGGFDGPGSDRYGGGGDGKGKGGGGGGGYGYGGYGGAQKGYNPGKGNGKHGAGYGY